MQRLPIQTPAPAVLSYAKAATYLGLRSVGALRAMQHRGIAPPSFKYGKRSRFFLVTKLDEWLAIRGRVEEVAATRAVPPRRPGRPTKMEAFERRYLKPV